METTRNRPVIHPPSPVETSRWDIDEAAGRISARTGIDAEVVRAVLYNGAQFRELGLS